MVDFFVLTPLVFLWAAFGRGRTISGEKAGGVSEDDAVCWTRTISGKEAVGGAEIEAVCGTLTISGKEAHGVTIQYEGCCFTFRILVSRLQVVRIMRRKWKQSNAILFAKKNRVLNGQERNDCPALIRLCVGEALVNFLKCSRNTKNETSCIQPEEFAVPIDPTGPSLTKWSG